MTPGPETLPASPSAPDNGPPESDSTESSAPESPTEKTVEQHPSADKLFNVERDLKSPEVVKGVNEQFERLLDKDTHKAAHYLAEMKRAGFGFKKEGMSEKAQEKFDSMKDKLLGDRDKYREAGATTYSRYLVYLKHSGIIEDIGDEDKQLLNDQLTVGLNSKDNTKYDLSLLAMDAKYLGAKEKFTEEEFSALEDSVSAQMEKHFDNKEVGLIRHARLKYLDRDRYKENAEGEIEAAANKIDELRKENNPVKAARLATIYQKYFNGTVSPETKQWLKSSAEKTRSNNKWGSYIPLVGDLRQLDKKSPTTNEAPVETATAEDESASISYEEETTPGTSETQKLEQAAAETRAESVNRPEQSDDKSEQLEGDMSISVAAAVESQATGRPVERSAARPRPKTLAGKLARIILRAIASAAKLLLKSLKKEPVAKKEPTAESTSAPGTPNNTKPSAGQRVLGFITLRGLRTRLRKSRGSSTRELSAKLSGNRGLDQDAPLPEGSPEPVNEAPAIEVSGQQQSSSTDKATKEFLSDLEQSHNPEETPSTKEFLNDLSRRANNGDIDVRTPEDRLLDNLSSEPESSPDNPESPDDSKP